MRSVDYGKCWPFGIGVEGQRFLPDMPVRKFRWWDDELQAMRSDSETLVPARDGFCSEKNIRATELQAQLLAAGKLPADGHEEGASVEAENVRQAKVCSPARMKQRTPKKRSIVELFAVSPPMKAVKSKTNRSGEGPKDQKKGEDTQDGPQEDQVAEAKDSRLDSGDGEVLPEKKSSKGRKKMIKDDEPKSKNKIGIKKKIMKKKKKKKIMKKKKKKKKKKGKKKEERKMKKEKNNKLVKVDINTEKMMGDRSFDGGDASSSDSEDSGVGSGSSITPQKRKRGIVSMNKVNEARKSGTKIKVEFNDEGQPIRKNKSIFVDYIGVVARNHIPLTENDWRDTPEELKQRLWEDIEQCFQLCEGNRKLVYKKLGKAARDFRAKMSKRCYDSEGNPIMTPPAEYAHLGVVKDTWSGFVEAVGSGRFKQMSQSNSVNAQNKKYSHRSGALGYAQLRESMREQLAKEPPARHRIILWRELRRNADGTVDEDVQRVYDEGEKIAATLTEEELFCRGPYDILARVAEIKEYHGRVLTAGFGVTKGDYFGMRHDTSNEAHVYQLTQLVMEMGSQIRTLASQVEGLQAQLHNQAGMTQPSFHESTIGQSGHDSCPSHVPPQFPPIPESATPVKKATYLREGCDVSPQACFIICKSFADHYAREDSFGLSMPDLFWGKAFEDQVSFEHVREVVGRQWLSASAICLYIRYLCDSYLYDEAVATRFSFISPHHELEHSHLVDMLLKHQEQDHLVMIPCNIGRCHWVLVAINMKTPDCIYYMDSLRVNHTHVGRADLVDKINKVMTSYRGIKKQSSARKKLTQLNNWVNIECPMQDPSTGLCGFYLCLFIEDILEFNSTNLSLAYFRKHRCDQFPESRITSVQQGWCSYFYHKFLVESQIPRAE